MGIGSLVRVVLEVFWNWFLLKDLSFDEMVGD